MTEIQASLGISQLDNLKKWISTRNNIAKEYNKNLTSLPLKNPSVLKNFKSSFHLYVVLLKNEKDRNGLFNFLKKKNIQCNFHYIPLYRHPFYEVKKKFFTRYHDSKFIIKSIITSNTSWNFYKTSKNYI